MDGVLHELLPRKVRLWIYVVVFLALLGLTAWQASEGNAQAAIVSFLSTVAPLLAANHLPKPLDHTPAVSELTDHSLTPPEKDFT